MWRAIFHGVAVAHFGYGLYYDQLYVNFPHAMGSDEFRHFGGFRGRPKYLTMWNMILQAVYFGLCLVNDAIGSNEINPKTKPLIRKVKDYMFASIAFPIAMFVGMTFWSLMAIDRELVFPKILDLYFPSWLNHVMHTNIMIFAIFEVVTTFRMYPKRLSGMKGLVLFMGIYLIWTHVIFYKSGQWVYPVLDVLNWWQRIAFFSVMIFFAAFLYVLGEWFNNKVWEKEVKQLEGKKGRRKEICIDVSSAMGVPGQLGEA